MLGATGRTVVRGVKAGGKGLWRNKKKILGTAAAVYGGAAGLAFGAAKGIIKGDPSAVLSGAITGAGTGAFAGKQIVNLGAGIGTGIGSIGRGVGSTAGNVRNAFREELHGIDEAAKMREEKEEKAKLKAFMKDDEQKREAKKVQRALEKKGKKVELDDIMRSRFDYVKTGISNEDIKRAQIAEAERGIGGDTHKNYVDLAKEADKLGINKATFSDTKKYNEFADTMKANFGGSERTAMEAMRIMGQIKGAEKENMAQAGRRARSQRESDSTLREQPNPRQNQSEESGTQNPRLNEPVSLESQNPRQNGPSQSRTQNPGQGQPSQSRQQNPGQGQPSQSRQQRPRQNRPVQPNPQDPNV